MEPEFVNVIIYFVWIAVTATTIADNNNNDDTARLFYWEGANKTAYNSQWKRKQRTYCTKLRSILFVQPKDRPFSSCSFCFCFCIGIGIGIVFFLSLFSPLLSLLLLFVFYCYCSYCIYLWLFTLNLLDVYFNNCPRSSAWLWGVEWWQWYLCDIEQGVTEGLLLIERTLVLWE